MPDPQFYALTVREEPQVEDAVDEATARNAQAEAVFEAAKWRLARDPDCGTVVPDLNPERFLVHLPPVEGANNPGLLIRYFQVKEIIVIDRVRFYDPEDGVAVRPEAFTI